MKALKKIGKFFVLLLVAGLAWTAWAAAAFYDLTTGLQSADPVALERRIDWVNVRRALREDLQASPIAEAGNRSVDALVSAPAIANLLRTAKLDDRGWETAAEQLPYVSPSFAWLRVRYAFYTGSPFSFRVDLRPDSDTPRPPLVLLFRWTGDWRLVRIFLPGQTQARPALASQSPPPPSPATAAVPLPSGAQRVMLFEEVPDDPQGKRYTGSVTWRAEQTPPTAAGGTPGFAVIAQVAMPDRPLDMTMTIRRNLDPALPASHIIEINFSLPPDSNSGGISDMVGVMMKPDEEAPGQHLAGSRAKVRDGFFILGLSSLAVDVLHNMDVLKNRPWFGIPIRYKNGSRAVLVIEKGEAGEKAFGEAFTRWNAPAAAADGASAKRK